MRTISKALLVFFILTAVCPLNPVMCYGSDGHAAVELMPCGPNDRHAQHVGMPPSAHRVMADFQSDCCGPCRDIPFLSDASMFSRGVGRNPLLFAKKAAHVFPAHTDNANGIAGVRQFPCSPRHVSGRGDLFALRAFRLLI